MVSRVLTEQIFDQKHLIVDVRKNTTLSPVVVRTPQKL